MEWFAVQGLETAARVGGGRGGALQLVVGEVIIT